MEQLVLISRPTWNVRICRGNYSHPFMYATVCTSVETLFAFSWNCNVKVVLLLKHVGPLSKTLIAVTGLINKGILPTYQNID